MVETNQNKPKQTGRLSFLPNGGSIFVDFLQNTNPKKRRCLIWKKATLKYKLKTKNKIRGLVPYALLAFVYVEFCLFFSFLNVCINIPHF